MRLATDTTKVYSKYSIVNGLCCVHKPRQSDALHYLYHNGLSLLYHDVPNQTAKRINEEFL